MLLEANYNFSVLPGLHLMPDIQYVIRPNGENRISNALVLGFQVSAKF